MRKEDQGLSTRKIVIKLLQVFFYNMNSFNHKGHGKKNKIQCPVLVRCLFVVLVSPPPAKTSVSDLVLFQNGCVVLVIRKKNKQAYKLENLWIVVIFIAFVLRVLPILCTEQDRHPLEERVEACI